MKTKSEQTIAWWDPYATSTPLKKLPNQLGVRSDSQKQLALKTDSENVLEKFQNAYSIPDFLRDKSTGASHQVSYRSDKNRLSTHFDICSSSDDDASEIQKRPIIKVSSKKNSKILLNVKEDDIADPGLKYSSSRKPRKNISIKSSKTNVPTVEISRGSKHVNQNKKNKIQTKTTSNLENIDRNCNEENIYFKKQTTNKKTLGGAKHDSRSKENSNSELRNYLDRHPSSFNEAERKKLQKVRKAILQSKPVEKNTNDNSQGLKACEIENILGSPQKKKIKKVTNASPLKKKTKKVSSKNLKSCALRKMVLTVNVNASQNKSNLSHQLFSESTEQEYINILDLTSDEVNEAAKRMKNSLQEKNSSACEQFKCPYPSNQNQNPQSSNKEERPKRKKQAPKEFWMPDEKPSKIKTVTSTNRKGKGSKESHVVSECQGVELPKNFKESFKETSAVKICEVENSHTQNDQNKEETVIDVLDNKTDKIPTGSVSNCLDTEMNISIQKTTVKCKEDKKAFIASEKSEFIKSEGLSFNWRESGCSVVQCWNIKKFKTGIFKLKVKSQFTCKTLCSNYWGGILVKGNIKMKIGTKEEDLKEGDMAVVPPMTEWHATNTGECESVFYYWCGRF